MRRKLRAEHNEMLDWEEEPVESLGAVQSVIVEDGIVEKTSKKRKLSTTKTSKKMTNKERKPCSTLAELSALCKDRIGIELVLPEEKFSKLHGKYEGDERVIAKYARKAAVSSQKRKNPQVLVVSSSARRSAELCKHLRDDEEYKGVEKLFAKHISITEQVKSLGMSRFPLAVGTPNRLLKLEEMKALKLCNVKLVIVDLKRDVKEYSIVDMPQISEDLYKFLQTCSLHFHEDMSLILV